MKVSDEEALRLEAEERRRLIDLFYRTESVAFLWAALPLRKADPPALDKADWVCMGHGSHTAPVGRPTYHEYHLLFAMAKMAHKTPELSREPHKLARLAAEGSDVRPYYVDSRVRTLVKKWRKLPSQDIKGVNAAWWAERIRAGGYPEVAEELLNRARS